MFICLWPVCHLEGDRAPLEHRVGKSSPPCALPHGCSLGSQELLRGPPYGGPSIHKRVLYHCLIGLQYCMAYYLHLSL